MTLGDELRAALNQEADLRTVTRPDVDRLIAGGRGRRRQRDLTRAVVSALAVVLVGGGVYAVTQDRSEPGGSRIADQHTATPEPSGVAGPPALAVDPGSEPLDPGTYRVVVGNDSTGTAIQADITFEDQGWMAGDNPVAHVGAYKGGFAVYRPFTLAAGSGCIGDRTRTDLGESPQALVERLTRLPASRVIQPITATEVLGRDALHLRVRFRDVHACLPQWYQVAETPRGSRGISYLGPSPAVVMDFWVVEVAGVPVVLDSWFQTGASAALVDQIEKARESITFVPRK